MKSNRQRGFTLIEVTVVLMALAILAAVLVPSIGNLNSLARKVRMKEDLGVLCSTLKMMLDDLGASSFFEPHARSGAGVAGAAFYRGSSASSTGGGVTFRQETEYDVDRGWCEDCNMPGRDCGPECMDDCGPDCHGHDDCGPDCYARQPTDVTTQTYGYESGASTGASAGYSSSNPSYGGSGYGGSYGLHGFPVGLLVGDGDIPGSSIGATEWQLQVGSQFSAATHGILPVALQFSVSTFADQLIHRDPTLGYGRAYAASYGSASSSYAARGYGGAFGAAGYVTGDRHFRWRGPYIADAVIPDPWGNRYMANVFGLHVASSHPSVSYPGRRHRVPGFTSAVVCYTAGPNELVETHFNQPFGWYTGGDDVTAVLAGAGGIR